MVIDLEKALIGALLTDLGNIKFLPENFSMDHLSSKNSIIFGYLSEKEMEGIKNIDLVEMTQIIQVPASYLIECKELAEQNYTAGWIGFENTARIIIDQYNKQLIKGFLSQSLRSIDSSSPEETLRNTEIQIDQIKNSFEGIREETVLDISKDFIERLKKGRLGNKLSSKMEWFDIRHPMIEGELHVIGGKEGLCKSAFTMRYALEVVLKGQRAYYWSLEMKRIAQMARIGSILTNYDSVSIEENKLDSTEKERLFEVMSDPLLKNFIIEDREINRGQFENIQRKFRPNLIVVDYIQQMAPIRGLSDEGTIASNIRWLKSIAMKYSCVVISVSQFHRSEKSERKVPQNSDFRGSGVIEHAADGTILIYSVEDEVTNWRKQQLIFKQGKMRRARKFKMSVEYDPIGYRFKNIEQLAL